MYLTQQLTLIQITAQCLGFI
uniref:Uncharacterized protein n=1 Tax=Anguilla anguilla TaxID=7936 RepID=A0A0E9TMP7_ANGAN